MNVICRVLVFLILISGIQLFGQDTNKWKVQVIRLIIASPPVMARTNLSGKPIPEKTLQALENLRARNGWSPGVTVSLRITAPEGQIANLPDSSTIESFTDDKGSNLLDQTYPYPENYAGESKSGISHFSYTVGEPSFSVEIRAPNLPSKNATELNIVGKISVQTANGSEQLVAQNVKLKPGVVFGLGAIKLKVSDAKFFDKGQFGIDLYSEQNLSSISELQFFDQRGNEIKPADESLNSSDLVCFFHKRLDTVKIVTTHWLGFKTTEVPINIKVGLGL